MSNPKELYYTKDHDWLKIEGNKAVMGITDYAQNELGDIVFVELPAVGDEFAKGDSIAVVESVKAASDIYAPISGVVTAINETLVDSPELANESPFEEGWFIEFEITNEDEVKELLSASEYDELVKGD
ncbi:MAG: glycine cleavage system protein GcvH [Firmicutes bacterium]|nr:glycine cleavage system protein GcvH [Bacillota bacterium]